MPQKPARAERAVTTSHDETEFSFSSGTLYAEKDEYTEKNLTFAINSVEFQPGAGFESSDRWAVMVSPDDGRPDKIITLQSNDKRDAELEAAAAHIAKHGPICNTKLVRAGKAYYFRKADTKSP